MKELKIILVVLLIILPIFGVYRYVENMSPVWSVTESQKALIDLQQRHADAVIDVQAHEERSRIITDALSQIDVVFMLFAAGVGSVFIWSIYDKRQESRARAVDGQFALQQRGPWMIDPNKSIFGVVGVDPATKQISTDANLVGADRQLTYAMNVQKTRSIAAKAPDARKPSRNELLAESGFFDSRARVEDARAQLAERRLLEQDQPAERAEDQPLPNNWRPLTLQDAFNRSEPDKWIIGQNATGPCEFDIFSTVHTGLLGATKCGKTSSTALLMALNAAKHGMKVIALDGADGVDWQPYSEKFEVYETDYTRIGDQLDQIVAIHARRMKEIKRAGKPNIDELDYKIPSLFIILEEFGRTMQAFKSANSRQYDASVSALSNLMRVARKTGIYFLIIDQSMAGWDQLIKPNVKDYISYHLGGNQGAAFNAYKLHELKPKGQFWNNGNVYDAWYTRGEVKPLLQKLPALRTKMLTDVEYSVIDTGIDTGIVDRGESKAQIHSPKHDTSIDTGTKNTPVNDTGIDTSTDTSTGIDTSTDTGIKKPLIEGKPVSAKDKNTVRNVYAMAGSVNETCRLIWGAKTPSRAAWVKEIIQGEQAQ